MSALEIAFWLTAALVVYVWIGYGTLCGGLVALRRVLQRRRGQAPAPAMAAVDAELPAVTLVVAAWNEAAVLPAKVLNCRLLDYPSGKLRLLFVTDGSNDEGPALLARERGVELLHDPVRRGKAAALARAVAHVRTPIVAFTDANTLLDPGAIRALVGHFADPRVGGVAGEKRVLAAGGAEGRGEGLYWRYESTLKRWDAELGSVVGAAGELFALRTALWPGLEPDTVLDDFVISLRLVERGWRVAYEPAAVALESPSASLRDEMKRKARICAGGFQAIGRLSLWNPLRHGIVAWQYLSHRVLRWTAAPAAIPLLLAMNAALAVHEGGIYVPLLAAQLVFHLAAVLGLLLPSAVGIGRALYVPLYFDLMHVAAWAGFARWVRGRQSVLWERAARA